MSGAERFNTLTTSLRMGTSPTTQRFSSFLNSKQQWRDFGHFPVEAVGSMLLTASFGDLTFCRWAFCSQSTK